MRLLMFYGSIAVTTIAAASSGISIDAVMVISRLSEPFLPSIRARKAVGSTAIATATISEMWQKDKKIEGGMDMLRFTMDE